jgi:hypothetical protein
MRKVFVFFSKPIAITRPLDQINQRWLSDQARAGPGRTPELPAMPGRMDANPQSLDFLFMGLFNVKHSINAVLPRRITLRP